MHGLNMSFHLFATPARNNCFAFLMHRKHQFVGLLIGVSKIISENISDIGHEVDRVVPHNRDPRALWLNDHFASGLIDFDGGRNGHAPIVSQTTSAFQRHQTLGW